MKLWLLRPIDESTLWDWQYDKAFGFVIRAESEQQARAYAASGAGDERRMGHGNPWEDPAFTSCEVLSTEGDAGEVMQDFRAG